MKLKKGNKGKNNGNVRVSKCWDWRGKKLPITVYWRWQLERVARKGVTNVEETTGELCLRALTSPAFSTVPQQYGATTHLPHKQISTSVQHCHVTRVKRVQLWIAIRGKPQPVMYTFAANVNNYVTKHNKILLEFLL